MNIKGGHSSSGDGGSFLVVAGSSANDQGGQVRVSSGSADVSGAVALESGAGGVESEDVFVCSLTFFCPRDFCCNASFLFTQAARLT